MRELCFFLIPISDFIS